MGPDQTPTSAEIKEHALRVLQSTQPLMFQKNDRHVWLYCLVHCARPAPQRGTNPIFLVSGGEGVGKTTLIQHSAALSKHRWPIFLSSYLSDSTELQKTLGGSLPHSAAAGDAIVFEDLQGGASRWGCEALAAYCSAPVWHFRAFGQRRSIDVPANLSIWATVMGSTPGQFIDSLRRRVVEIRLVPPRASKEDRRFLGLSGRPRPAATAEAVRSLQFLAQLSPARLPEAIDGPPLPPALARAVKQAAS